MSYSIILADPPWFYNNRKTGGERNDKTKFGGGAQKHYQLLKAHEIIDPAITLDVKSLKADPSILFLWVTGPMLYDSTGKGHCVETVINGWGFEYATIAAVWNKTTQDGSAYNYGPGYYTASNTELLLVCTSGGAIEPAEKMLPSIINAPVREHSRKPDEAYKLIERMYPNHSKIELFARTQRPGWDAWGNQTELFKEDVCLS